MSGYFQAQTFLLDVDYLQNSYKQFNFERWYVLNTTLFHQVFNQVYFSILPVQELQVMPSIMNSCLFSKAKSSTLSFEFKSLLF